MPNQNISPQAKKTEIKPMSSAQAKSQAQADKKEYVQMPFGKVNFIMMACCMALIIIGFMLMSGGGDASETAFNPEIFSTRRIVVGPTLTFLGFLFMAFAIIWKKKK